MSETETIIGGIALALAVILQGTILLPFRQLKSRLGHADSFLFSFFLSLGVILCSICVFPFVYYNDIICLVPSTSPAFFSLQPFIAGAICGCSTGLSYMVVLLSGMAIGSGSWGLVQLLTSFLLGVYIIGDTITNTLFLSMGMLCIISGFLGISLIETYSPVLQSSILSFLTHTGFWRISRSVRTHASSIPYRVEDIENQSTSTYISQDSSIKSFGFVAKRIHSFIFGNFQTDLKSTSTIVFKKVLFISVAILSGIFGGIFAWPLYTAPIESRGLATLLPFSVGAFLSISCLCLIYNKLTSNRFFHFIYFQYYYEQYGKLKESKSVFYKKEYDKQKILQRLPSKNIQNISQTFVPENFQKHKPNIYKSNSYIKSKFYQHPEGCKQYRYSASIDLDETDADIEIRISSFSQRNFSKRRNHSVCASGSNGVVESAHYWDVGANRNTPVYGQQEKRRTKSLNAKQNQQQDKIKIAYQQMVADLVGNYLRAALASAAIWTAAFVALMIATPRLGFTIVFTCVQMSAGIATFCGVFIFRELQGRVFQGILLFIWTFVGFVVGALLLSLSIV